jgi:hypothetical protein
MSSPFVPPDGEEAAQPNANEQSQQNFTKNYLSEMQNLWEDIGWDRETIAAHRAELVNSDEWKTISAFMDGQPSSSPAGKSAETLRNLQRPRRTIENDNLDSCVEQFVHNLERQRLIELLFTSINHQMIPNGIYSHKEVYVESESTSGVMDIVLSRDPGGEDRLAIIQIGLRNSDWFKTFHSGSLCVHALMESSKDGDPGKEQKPKQPLLLAALTMESNEETDWCQSTLGVFLCVPSNSGPNDPYEIMPMKYTKSQSLTDVSKDFGQLLRTTFWFSDWLLADEPNP